MLIYINGEYFTKEDAKVSVFDHGLMYGDGVFETMRSYNGIVHLLRAHVERLFRSMESIGLEIDITKKDVEAAIKKTLFVNKLKDAYIRLSVTRGEGEIGLIKKCKPTIIIIAKQFEPYPESIYSNGVKVATVKIERPFPIIKSLNFMSNIIAKKKFPKKFEVLMVNKWDQVTEGTISNVFIVSKGSLITPKEDMLPGITRQNVIEIAKRVMPVNERNLTVKEIKKANECFITNTSGEIIPVIKVDDTFIGSGKPGETTVNLLKLFRDEVDY